MIRESEEADRQLPRVRAMGKPNLRSAEAMRRSQAVAMAAAVCFRGGWQDIRILQSCEGGGVGGLLHLPLSETAEPNVNHHGRQPQQAKQQHGDEDQDVARTPFGDGPALVRQL